MGVMVRPSAKQIEEELDQQEDINYGDDLSSAPDPEKITKDEGGLGGVVGGDGFEEQEEEKENLQGEEVSDDSLDE
jgi:hypothetical protein